MKRLPINATIRISIVDKLSKKYGFKCAYCGLGLKKTKFHIDHVIPLSKQGKHSIENMVLACKTCNRAKWDMGIQQFFRWVKRLRWVDRFPYSKYFTEVYNDIGDEPERIAPVKQVYQNTVEVVPDGYERVRHVDRLSIKDYL